MVRRKLTCVGARGGNVYKWIFPLFFFFIRFFFLWSTAPFVNVAPSPPPLYLCLLTIPLLTPIEGTEKIEYDRGTGENRRTNEQTRTNLGLTKSRGRYCNTICMCGLSLAWVTSENSTMLLESDSSWLTLAGPYPMLPRLSAPVSGVFCPCPFFHANPLLFASFAVQPPTALCSVASSTPFASPYHFRIRRDFMSKNPLSGFAPKQTRLLWRPTHIVLQNNLQRLIYPKKTKKERIDNKILSERLNNSF